MGRISFINNKVIRDTIIKYISNGNYIKTACLAAGVDDATYYTWIHRAENANGDPSDKIYVDFLEELKKARAQNVADRVSKIQEAGNKEQNWTANAWLLERMEPGDYGKREVLELGVSKVLLALQENARKYIDAPLSLDTPTRGTEHDVRAVSVEVIEDIE